MIFLDMQTAVLADTFDESKRADSKNWLNTKYTEICDIEDWTFMRGSGTVSVAVGSNGVTGLPSDFAIANALLDQYGCPLAKIVNPEEFWRRYGDTTTTVTGQPEAFTVDASTILVGPKSSVTSSSFRLLYKKTATLLVADSDIPIVPSGYHMGIVMGARAIGLRLIGATSEAEEADSEFRAAIDSMRNSGKYLTTLDDRTPEFPAYRPY